MLAFFTRFMGLGAMTSPATVPILTHPRQPSSDRFRQYKGENGHQSLHNSIG